MKRKKRKVKRDMTLREIKAKRIKNKIDRLLKSERLTLFEWNELLPLLEEKMNQREK